MDNYKTETCGTCNKFKFIRVPHLVENPMGVNEEWNGLEGRCSDNPNNPQNVLKYNTACKWWNKPHQPPNGGNILNGKVQTLIHA